MMRLIGSLLMLFACAYFLLSGSCSYLSMSGVKGDYIYGEGISPESKSLQFAKALSADNSRTDIGNYTVDRYRMYFQEFIKEAGLSEDSKEVRSFENILKQFSPKPGVIDIRIEGMEEVQSEKKERNGNFKVTIISRIHIGSIDKTLLKKIEMDQSMFPVFMKTKLYTAMLKRIDDFE